MVMVMALSWAFGTLFLLPMLSTCGPTAIDGDLDICFRRVLAWIQAKAATGRPPSRTTTATAAAEAAEAAPALHERSGPKAEYARI